MRLKSAQPATLAPLFNNPWQADAIADFVMTPANVADEAERKRATVRKRLFVHSAVIWSGCPRLAQALCLQREPSSSSSSSSVPKGAIRLLDSGDGRKLPLYELNTGSTHPLILISLVKYLYSGEWNLGFQESIMVASMARLLGLTRLHLAAETIVRNHWSISAENVGMTFSMAKKNNLRHLASECVAFVLRTPSSLTMDENIMRIPSDMLLELLASDLLPVSEQRIFEIIKKRVELVPGDAVPDLLSQFLVHVRFNGISKEYFENSVVPSKLIPEWLVPMVRDMTGISENSRPVGNMLESRAPKIFLPCWHVPLSEDPNRHPAVSFENLLSANYALQKEDEESSVRPGSNSDVSGSGNLSRKINRPALLRSDNPLHSPLIPLSQRKVPFDYVEFTVNLNMYDEDYTPSIHFGVVAVTPLMHRPDEKLLQSPKLPRVLYPLDSLLAKCPDPAVRKILDSSYATPTKVALRVGIVFNFAKWELFFSVNGEVLTKLAPAQLTPAFQRSLTSDGDEGPAAFSSDTKIETLNWFPVIEISGPGKCNLKTNPWALNPK